MNSRLDHIITVIFRRYFLMIFRLRCTERFIYYRKYILQITQPSQYRCTELHYGFAVISETPSK